MSSSKNIFLLRHGSTDYNLKHLMQGNIDIPLNAAGRSQAVDACNFFRNIQLDSIYSSPLARAMETAQTVNNPHNLEITQLEELREISMGSWEGKDYFLLKEQHPEFFINWRSDVQLRLPEGESYSDLYKRVEPAVKNILESGGHNILIVAHSATNRMVLAALSSMELLPARGFIMSNCGISRIKYFEDSPESCTVEYWNRTGHLNKER